MRLTVLIDNRPSPCGSLHHEHGLAMHFTYKGKSFLVDTGASALFAGNARALGIDIADVDYLVLSHAHADHTGGLRAFLELNSKAQVYLSQIVIGNSFCSTRRGAKRDISPDGSLFGQYSSRFVPLTGDIELCEGVAIISDIRCAGDCPKANATLLKNDLPDDFSHEICLTVESVSGRVVLSPCSHKGVTNILDSIPGNVVHFVGGLHLLDIDENTSYESEDELHAIALAIKARGTHLHTGHCTGECAKRVLSQVLGASFSEFFTGYAAEL